MNGVYVLLGIFVIVFIIFYILRLRAYKSYIKMKIETRNGDNYYDKSEK